MLLSRLYFPSSVSKTWPVALLCAALGAGGAGCLYEFDRNNDLGPGDVAGQAVRPSGEVASFASVRIEGLPIRATAQPDGHFLVRGVPEGTWRLNAKDDVDQDGWPERSAVVGFRILNTAAAEGLFGTGEPALSSVNLGEVVLEGTIRLEGVVEDDTGAVAPDARVVIVHDSVPIAGVDSESVPSFGAVESRVATGQDGRFIVPAVAAGTFVVIAYAERDAGLFISPPTTVTQFSGAASLVGDDRLILSASDQERAVAFGVAPAPDASSDVTLRLRRAGAGSDVPTDDRTATFDDGTWTVDAVPLGPWTVQVLVDGVLTSRLEPRFVLPGTGPQAFGAFVVSDGSCRDCDCDGDGIRGLPQPPESDVRNAICDGSAADARSIWDACEARCGAGARVCLSGGIVYDCEDDLDGQSDVAEPACYGVDKGGADCDGDGICEVFDPDDRCANGRLCNPEDVVNLCAGGNPVVVDDGGVEVDAGADAGFPSDGGDPDGGPGDGGILVDAGPGDAGEPADGGADGGPFDAGPVDAGPVDAGPPGLVLPPGFEGTSVSAPFSSSGPGDLLALYFEGTVTRLTDPGGEGPPPTFPPCAVDRLPPDTTNVLFLQTNDDGTCEFITGLGHADLDDDDLLAMAAAADGGFYAVFSHQDDAVVGVDSAGESVFANTPGAITFVHYLPDGTVGTFRSIPIGPGVFPFDVDLVSHPLAQGPVAMIAFGDEFAGTFEVDGLSVDNNAQATVAIFFDEALQATDLQLLGDNFVDVFLATQPSPTQVVIGGGSSDVVFPQSPAELPANDGFIGAFSPSGPTWGRLVNGFEGNVVFGADVVAEEFWFALDGRIVKNSLVVTTATTVEEIEVDTKTASPTALVPAGAASVDIDPDTDAILYADNTATPPGVFTVAQGATVAERVLAAANGENFTDVRWATDGAFVVRDDVGDLKLVSAFSPDPETISSGVETSIAVDRNFNEVYYVRDGTIHSAFLGSTPTGFARGIAIESGLLAHDGSGLVWYSVEDGSGQFRIVDPSNIFVTTPFLTAPPLTGAREMVYDEARETFYVLTDGGILEATGVNLSTTAADGVTLDAFGGPAAPIAMGRQRGETVGLVRGDASVTEIVGPGVVHVIHVDGSGEVSDVLHVGEGEGRLKVQALGVRGDNVVVGGAVDGVVSFATEFGPPLVVRNDDATPAISNGGSYDELAVIQFQRSVDATLNATWARQSETNEFAFGAFAPFADASMGVLVDAFREVRLGDEVVASEDLGLHAVWRLGELGGATISTPEHPPLIDTGAAGPDGFDPLDVSNFTGVRFLLGDGYVTTAPMPGVAGEIFAGTNCAFNPQLDFGTMVIKRSFDGTCQWLRAYRGDDLALDVIPARVGNHVVIAVGAGDQPVAEYDSLVGGAFVPRVASGFAVTHIADDGGTIASFEISVANDGSLPVRAVAHSDGSFGALANVIQDATLFAGGGEEVTLPVATPGQLHVVAAVANFDGSARVQHMLGGDDDMSILSATSLNSGSLLVLASLDAPIGAARTYLDGAITLAGGDARNALFRLEPDGSIQWISTLANCSIRDRVATTPGGTSFAVIADYSSDFGDFSAEFPLGAQLLQAFDGSAGATAIIVGDTADGVATFNASIEHIGQAEAVHFNAVGQLSVAIGVNASDDQSLEVFFPTSYTNFEPGEALRKKTVWRFSSGDFNGKNYSSRESFRFTSFAQEFDIVGHPFVEEMVVLQGGGGQPFVGENAVERTPGESGFPILWRLQPTGVIKGATPQ